MADQKIIRCPECGEEMWKRVDNCPKCGFGLTYKGRKIKLKEDQKDAKIKRALERYRLESLSDEDDFESVLNIFQDLSGTKVLEIGSLLGGSERDYLKLQFYYQKAIFEQNFIIIRQLDKIANAINDTNPFTQI